MVFNIRRTGISNPRKRKRTVGTWKYEVNIIMTNILEALVSIFWGVVIYIYIYIYICYNHIYKKKRQMDLVHVHTMKGRLGFCSK